MEKERNNMAGFAMVSIEKLTHSEHNIKEHPKGMGQLKLDTFVRKFGQFQSVLVATVNNEIKIVDGNEMVRSLKRNGITEANCFHLGELNEKEYLMYRVFLNAAVKRLDYIGIAEVVKKVGNNEQDLIQISNTTGIDLKDVKRYKELLEFDWNDFLNQQPDPSQLDIFNIINERE